MQPLSNQFTSYSSLPPVTYQLHFQNFITASILHPVLNDSLQRRHDVNLVLSVCYFLADYLTAAINCNNTNTNDSFWRVDKCSVGTRDMLIL